MRRLLYVSLMGFTLALGGGCSDEESGSPASGDVAITPGTDGESATGVDGSAASDAAQTPDAAGGLDVPNASSDASVGADSVDNQGDGLAGGDMGPPAPDVPIAPDVEPDTGKPPGQMIRFREPGYDVDVVGAFKVIIEPASSEEMLLDELKVYANGTLILSDTKAPTDFLLDSREYPPGAIDLRVEGRIGDVTGWDARRVISKNAPFRVLQVTTETPTVRNGSLVSLGVTASEPGVDITADFSSIDNGYIPGSELIYSVGAGRFVVAYTVSDANDKADGLKQIPLTFKVSSFTEVVHAEVTLRNGSDIPIRIRGALFVAEPLPAPSPEWTGEGPSLAAGNSTVVTGGFAEVTATFANPSRVTGLLLGVEGGDGYFQMPLDGSDGIEPLQMFLRAYTDEDGTPPATVTLKVATRDAIGRVSPFAEQTFSVAAVGSGDIQVSLSWDTPTDLDLYVVDPTGCELYYGNKECDSQGQLDLDSNAGCGIDGINNENIFWPQGQAPAGQYEVRTNFWSDCSCCDANWTVTLTYCGKTEVIPGYYAQGTDTGGGSGAGQLIGTFSNESCVRVVRGRVRYQDRTFDERGFGPTTWRPVRHAVVELRDLTNQQLVATATTDPNGVYEIGYTDEGHSGTLFVEVKTQTSAEEGLRDIVVMDHPKFKKVYKVGTPPIVDTGADIITHDVDISVDLDAGAFNIFDVITGGYDLIRRMTGKDLGGLSAFWATGSDTTDTLYCSSFFYQEGICSERFALSVQGKEIDRDEWDDMVILKEFFKFALEKTSRDDNPGGSHNGARDDSRRAWSEGLSRFFACDVLGTQYFVNSRPHGVYMVRDIEAADTVWAYKTSDGTMLGQYSEDMVASILWDFADNDPNEAHDAIAGGRQGVYDVVFNYFTSAWFVDRGLQGVELVDYLDGWYCRGWGQASGVDFVLDNHTFVYEGSGPETCLPPSGK